MIKGFLASDGRIFKTSVYDHKDTLRPIGVLAFIKVSCDTIIPQPQPVCYTDTVIDTCGADIKTYAYNACRRDGMVLNNLQMLSPCDKPGEQQIYCFTCCKTDTVIQPEVSSIIDTMGSSTSCKSMPTWSMYAASECSSKGLVLSSAWPLEICRIDEDTLYRYICYHCIKM
jgi:hypothetical protein